METSTTAYKEDPEKDITFRDILKRHEFFHAFKEWVNKSFNEQEYEEMLGVVRQKWSLTSLIREIRMKEPYSVPRNFTMCLTKSNFEGYLPDTMKAQK